VSGTVALFGFAFWVGGGTKQALNFGVVKTAATFLFNTV
jgi:hypothetical protein